MQTFTYDPHAPAATKLAGIRAHLAALIAPPWRWSGNIKQGRMKLATTHSGRVYVMDAFVNTPEPSADNRRWFRERLTEIFGAEAVAGATQEEVDDLYKGHAQPRATLRFQQPFGPGAGAQVARTEGGGIMRKAEELAQPDHNGDFSAIANPEAAFLQYAPEYVTFLLGQLAPDTLAITPFVLEAIHEATSEGGGLGLTDKDRLALYLQTLAITAGKLAEVVLASEDPTNHDLAAALVPLTAGIRLASRQAKQAEEARA